MASGPSFERFGHLSRIAGRSGCVLLLGIQTFLATSAAALPKRLVVAIDGISYRDMKALQAGVTVRDPKGRQVQRQGFHQGYFPVSRLVSTFPSASDVAWTEIFGDPPLPGYQRVYFSHAANSVVSVNLLTSSMEYEKKMTWRIEGGFRLAMSYARPRPAFAREVRQLAESFLNTRHEGGNYYAFIRSTDDAQHLACDILAMLCTLDETLQELRARYLAREGRDLEILILSDHGNNHAGAGQRVLVRSFLKKAGYRITKSIQSSKDVVLPTAGIESWVEVHNAPAETDSLVELLWNLKGVDLVTAPVPGQANRIRVVNWMGERALIEWNEARNSFRYSTEAGDPIDYRPVVEALARKHQLDSAGFASAEAWMAETLAHRYPLALERIVRGHTRVTLNPASILISLRNEYVHASWLIKKGSEFVKFGGTHGGIDDLNSTGMLLSSFAPTPDTSSSRVAALYGGFPGRRDFRAEESGAEWLFGKAQAMTTLPGGPLDQGGLAFPRDEVFLRIWTPRFNHLGREAPVEVTIEAGRHFANGQKPLGPSSSVEARVQHLTLDLPIFGPEGHSHERVYALPSALKLAPQRQYRISGRIREQKKNIRIFKFTFRTDSHGLPVAQ